MRFLALALAFMVPTAALAEQDPCADLVTTMDMQDCLGAVLDEDRLAMAAAYDLAIAGAKETDAFNGADAPSAVDLLERSQAAWTDYINLQCDYVTMADWGGSIRSLNYLACESDLTRARTMELGG